MNDDFNSDLGELQVRPPAEALVHWMERRPVSVGPGGAVGAAAAGFLLGAALTVTALALSHWLDPDRPKELLKRFRA